MTEQAFDIAGRVDQILADSALRQEMAEAARLLQRELLRPLLEAWRRAYPRVPPELAGHLKAQSEFCAIIALSKVLEELAAEAPEGMDGSALVERAIEQAQLEVGEREESDSNLE